MKIFLDANILFSASHNHSLMHKLITSLMDKGFELITSDYAFEEAHRNIVVKRKKWLKDFETLTQCVTLVSSCDLDDRVPLDQKDRVILGSAVKHQCDYCLTGDKKDFGHLFQKTIQGVKVLSPVQIAEELL